MRSKFETAIRDFLKGLSEKPKRWWYEPCKIPYRRVLKGNYTPDFVIAKRGPLKGKRVKKPLTVEELQDKLIIEAKGYFKKPDRDKMLAVKESHPDLDIRMLFQKDSYVYPNGRGKPRRKPGCKDMKYSDWCIKHGFPFAFGTEIPKEWLDD
jgi:hypothetical protein